VQSSTPLTWYRRQFGWYSPGTRIGQAKTCSETEKEGLGRAGGSVEGNPTILIENNIKM
jgi:hypothetical protein